MLALPLVTVIIPTYDRAYCLEETLSSVLNQSYNNYELIVVNDGSTDNTENLLKKFKGKIRYFNILRSGKSYSRNLALLNSSGEFIATLDSDDIWFPDYLEKSIVMMNEQKLDILFNKTINHGFVPPAVFSIPLHIFTYKELRNLILRYCPTPSSGVIFRRNKIGKGWNEQITTYEDWYLQIQSIISYPDVKAAFNQQVLWDKVEGPDVIAKRNSINFHMERLKASKELIKNFQSELTFAERLKLLRNYTANLYRLIEHTFKNVI